MREDYEISYDIPEDAPILVERIISRLNELQMSQVEFANKTGYDKASITQWLKKNKKTGKYSDPSFKAILAISKALSVSTDYLFGLTEAKTVKADKRAACDYTHLPDRIVDFFNSHKQPEAVYTIFEDNLEAIMSICNELFILAYKSFLSKNLSMKIMSDLSFEGVKMNEMGAPVNEYDNEDFWRERSEIAFKLRINQNQEFEETEYKRYKLVQYFEAIIRKTITDFSTKTKYTKPCKDYINSTYKFKDEENYNEEQLNKIRFDFYTIE